MTAAARDAAFYPDLAVHCHPRPKVKTTILESPSFILEVLSPSTRHYDLNAKRKEHFRIPSLPLTALKINLKLKDLYRQTGLL